MNRKHLFKRKQLLKHKHIAVTINIIAGTLYLLSLVLVRSLVAKSGLISLGVISQFISMPFIDSTEYASAIYSSLRGCTVVAAAIGIIATVDVGYLLF